MTRCRTAMPDDRRRAFAGRMAGAIRRTARTRSGSSGAAPMRSPTCCAARRMHSRCSSAAASRRQPISISRRRWRAQQTGCWRIPFRHSWLNCLSGRRLRVIEVGAGTGSATASVLSELPEGGYDYVYTDISAGFFSEAESRFGGAEASIDYRVLDIERDPVEQGFDLPTATILVIASNVLHATRYLNETLAHCLALLAPSGQLVALENLRGQGWPGPDLRAAGRLVALCRRLPPAPCARHPGRVAAGPRRCRFRGHRNPGVRRGRPQRQPGPRRDRGAGTRRR